MSSANFDTSVPNLRSLAAYYVGKAIEPIGQIPRDKIPTFLQEEVAASFNCFIYTAICNDQYPPTPVSISKSIKFLNTLDERQVVDIYKISNIVILYFDKKILQRDLLIIACKKGYLETIQFFEKNNTHINKPFYEIFSNTLQESSTQYLETMTYVAEKWDKVVDNSSLQVASIQGNLVLVKHLVEKLSQSENGINADNLNEALILARNEKHLDIVAFLESLF